MVHVFIVNAVTGKLNFADELREELKQFPEFEWYVFSTNGPGNEADLARTVVETFDEEQIRIYSVGGTGTLHNIINAVGLQDRVEFAFFPSFTSKFVDSIVEDSSGFYDLGAMLNGTAQKVDLVYANGTYALNAYSIGIDSKLLEVAKSTRKLGFLSSRIPYFLGLVSSVIETKNADYVVTSDDGSYEGTTTEIFFGNGMILGNGLHFAPYADAMDGKAYYRVVRGLTFPEKLRILMALNTGDAKTIDSFCNLFGLTENLHITRKDGMPFRANVDGELLEDTEFQVRMLPGVLNFVFPKEGMQHE